MSDELASRLRKLQDARDAEVIDEDAYQAGLVKLRDQYGAAAVDALLSQALPAADARSHTLSVGDAAELSVATSGDIHGDVQAGGQRYQAQLQVFFETAGVSRPNHEQRELVTSYLDTLARRCDRLRLTGVVDWERKKGRMPPFKLSQLYVTLATMIWEFEDEVYDKVELENIPNLSNADLTLPEDMRRIAAIQPDPGISHSGGWNEGPPNYRLERPVLVTEALSKRRRLILLGGPGSGKSMFLRHLAVVLARIEVGQAISITTLPRWDAGPLLPIYASLGGYAAWVQQEHRRYDGESLWDYLVSVSEYDALNGLRVELRRAFRNGGLVLLLDGLDEVADPKLRTGVAAAIAALGLDTDSYIAVTCRSRSFIDAAASPFAEWGEPVELAPFTLAQMQWFIKGWYAQSAVQGALEPLDAERRAAALVDHIKKLPALRDLGQTPLLLTIITILHYYEGKLPEDRADLYEDLVQLLLTRWTQQRREVGAPASLVEQLKVGGGLGGLKEYHLRNMLEELAYRAHQSAQSPDGRGLLERGVVREELIKLFEKFDLGPGPANEKSELVLHYLEQESGLLLHEGGDQYVLPHLTYEEYLAGCFLAKQKGKPDFRLLAYRHWREDVPRWREVIFLALGRMVRGDDHYTAAAWLQFLLEPSHGTRERNVAEQQAAGLFAIECLAEIGGKSALTSVETVALQQLWSRMAQAAVQVVEGRELPAARRVQVGVDLGRWGDLRPGVCTLPPVVVPIAGGPFVIGNGIEQAELTMAPFAIARYPVTNAQYALFIADTGYEPQQPWWDIASVTWLRTNRVRQPRNWSSKRFGKSRPNHPVVSITWYEAMAFSRWLSQHRIYNPERYIYSLPSEAEWEYAARGTQRRPYPWGDEEPDDERANFDEIYNGTTAVGCFLDGATPEGVLDLAGNVWEWTSSVYAPYPYDSVDGREMPDSLIGKHIAIRGGGWASWSHYLHSSNRYGRSPDYFYGNIGFRLARHSPL